MYIKRVRKMGVRGFYGFLVDKRYPDVLNRVLAETRASLHIDANSLLHKAAARAYKYGEEYFDSSTAEATLSKTTEVLYGNFINYLISDLAALVTFVNPQFQLTIAIDGVAPNAKIQQQRQRRYRTPEKMYYKNKRGETLEFPQLFDTNAFTPGTQIMRDIETAILEWLREWKNNLPPKIVFSGHLVPGEGN